MSKFNAPESKACCKCFKTKNTKDNYYLASDEKINTDGRLSICKSCLEEIANITVVEEFIDALRRIDRPFIKTDYEASLLHNNPFGEYMRRMGMRQNREFTYADSQFNEDLSKFATKNANDLNKKIEVGEVIKFKITPELIAKWGSGYSESEIFMLEDFYVRMKESNSITTPQHIESLKLLCKISLKQNQMLDAGNIAEFTKLNQQFNKLSEHSGFRPIDQVSGGESVGIRTFSQIWEEIERDGFIEPYPYEEKQDIIDKTIMYMLNYTRKLLNVNSLAEPPLDTPKLEEDDNEL